MSDTPVPYRPRCMHLTCKSMMVYGEDFTSDPDFQAGMVDFQCLRTASNQAPDRGEVALAPCSDPQRSCFEAF
jgi:hypothetical protein